MVVMIYKKGASLTACCWEVSTKKHNNQDIAEPAGRDVHTSGKLYRYSNHAMCLQATAMVMLDLDNRKQLGKYCRSLTDHCCVIEMVS